MQDDRDMTLSSGIAAFEAKEFRRALQLLTPLAEQGEAEAQFRLGVMFQNGLGVVANELRAQEWMRQGAEQDHPLAQHGLGVMYLYGEGVPQDDTQALYWFERGAAHGLLGSLTSLAMMYAEGRGVERNAKRARELYRQAGFDDIGPAGC